MPNRKYTAIVTVTLVSPEGKHLGSKSEDVTVKVDMKDFPEGKKEADKYMESELSTMLAAGAYNVEECF